MVCALSFPISAAAATGICHLLLGRGDKAVALTFDRPGARGHPAADRHPGRAQHPATFFVVGQWVDKYPESVLALHDAATRMMNHSNTHPHFTQLSQAQMNEEVNACADKIER
jgi:peptidoglycan/xylan/chitin deacetylase (PgdA/CDA1 family)